MYHRTLAALTFLGTAFAQETPAINYGTFNEAKLGDAQARFALTLTSLDTIMNQTIQDVLQANSSFNAEPMR